MFESSRYLQKLSAEWRQSTVAVVTACLLFCGAVAAQDAPVGTSNAEVPLPAAPGLPLKLTSPKIPGVKATNAVQPASGLGVKGDNGGTSFAQNPGDAPAGVRRITLDEAQQMAAGAGNPLARLGELQVEAAKQHRLGVQAMYFPNLGSQFYNLHLNKATGDVLTLRGPLGNVHQVASKIVDKDSTTVNLSAVQPVTPLMAIHQLVKIARADENIARAKAGMPVAETASRVEKNFYDLLVAQKELVSAEADAKKIQGKWLTASTGTPSVSTEEEKDMISAEKAVLVPSSKVKELNASLNEMLGLPEGTRLELVPPEPFVENISLTEVTDKAMAANPEVITAEQTAIKAHAAATISKMEYGPTVAIVGGYFNQNALNFILPRGASYIGVVGTFTIFDFGKREAGVKESKANAEAADLGVQLTKAKVAAAVKSSYFDLERSRHFTQLARRMMSATRVVEASYQTDNADVVSARAAVEADMFRAELEYRQAYARLKSLMGDK